ncbi:hypothetical protein LG651_11920 [Tamlana sp. 62-3]|uniref:Uncharacterized protein n=1 Tax=Neotamlana sargassicola TaxID=2883125 RepID=A0A9X1I9R0_9FLAO|nr:hypothetical protein [Tamlana sargassicola]MCB4808959.1 hypothetical protein [Tamlana sargassicola]
MKFYKIFQYAYLIFAFMFVYDAFTKWGVNATGAYISLAFAALAVFMFFFRRKFSKKFDNRNNSK